MTNYHPWDKYHGRIVSSRGGWTIGKGVTNCGFDMMKDLVGKCSYMQVVIMNATGRLPSRELADWVDAVHICLSWPDPRIWCNRIGALAGSSRASSVAATCLGVLSADSRSYGIKPIIEGVEFIQYALNEVNTGKTVEELVAQELKKQGGKPYLMGYARPIATGDERIPAMECVTKQLGFGIGEHLSLAYQIEKILNNEFEETMNINGYVSGFLSDQGFSSNEVYRIFSVVVCSGVTACYTDTIEKIEGNFAPLKAEDIIYKGKGLRKLPAKSLQI